MSNGFNKLAEGIGRAIETVPDVYDDALKPSAQESGKTLALIPRTINAMLVPLRQWIAEKEYNLAETEKLLAQKLERVDVDKIVTPEPYVAVPALQAISYSMNSEELRNLYANLLSKAMNIDTKDSVHPAFVDIIKQMSPLDAVIFNRIMNAQICPLITIKVKRVDSGEEILQEHCSWITDYSIKQCCASFNNLIRLGLIEIPPLLSYNHEENYNYVKQNPQFESVKKFFEEKIEENESLILGEEFIKTNELSQLFFDICVKGF